MLFVKSFFLVSEIKERRLFAMSNLKECELTAQPDLVVFYTEKFNAVLILKHWQKRQYGYQHEIAKYFLIFKHSPVKEFARSAFLHVL